MTGPILRKLGNNVGGIIFTKADMLPLAFRPSINSAFTYVSVSDSGVRVQGQIEVTTVGNLNVYVGPDGTLGGFQTTSDNVGFEQVAMSWNASS